MYVFDPPPHPPPSNLPCLLLSPPAHATYLWTALVRCAMLIYPSSALREHLLLAQNQSHGPQTASSPPPAAHEHNIDPAIAGSAAYQMSAGAESGGDDAMHDSRKGRRELSTSKRAAQNRAAQVSVLCWVVCSAFCVMLRPAFLMRVGRRLLLITYSSTYSQPLKHAPIYSLAWRIIAGPSRRLFSMGGMSRDAPPMLPS